MSRSRRHSPFIGHTTAGTDKPWKQQSARQMRRIVHQRLDQTQDGDALPSRRQVTDAWGMKDGKQRLTAPSAEVLRK
ncbi:MULTISPECIES: hypothetical protein [unclassified Sphingomonas]|jgi:hypothetical protein|uniref:hypothetical protein n=1 Tax=unclassified Sphingomonas TaxID=196159 RepID=UPI000E109758|nr:hypothetical protein [Sphingomonas sp. FARSPH]AXJ95139.1 hypothetical protein DM480_06080 [Sphingomonas sp. FARSPH]